MLRTASWLMRAGAYVLIGADVLARAPLGPVALPVTATAYALCGALLAVWAALEYLPPVRRPARALPTAVALGLIAALSSAVAVQNGSTTALVALAVIATLDAGTETRLAAGWGVFGAGVLSAVVGALVVGASAPRTLGVVVGLAVGLLTGLNRRSYRVQAAQSAALLDQAEELREQQRQVAVLDERARIAREIHDVLAHSLGALGIQIQAARALLTDHQDPGRAVEVLAVAQRMASDGLGETRRAVHALRTDTLPLDEELARMAATHEQRHGSTVTLTVTGAAVPLPADRTLALLRTAHESLTNAAKHAPHRPVAVDLLYGDEDVTLTLTNALGGPPWRAAGTPDFRTVDGGYGLTGMRERLLLLDGTLAAGPDEGRWTVTARVPSAGGGRV